MHWAATQQETMISARKDACNRFAASRLPRVGAAAFLAVGLAGCSSVDLTSFRLPTAGDLRLPAMNAPVPVEARKPVPAEELVDSEGRCASSPMAAAETAPEAASSDPVTTPTNPALAVGGIALGMTECDVVKRAGPPEKVVLGTDERGERKVILTYTGNMRPGVYTFTAGRLVTIERAPEPPAAAKPTRPARPTKPKPKPAPS
jgi:hypothetical protein